MPDPLNAVVDLSHHNGNVDLQAAKNGGIIGVIHKATQGLTGVDPMYQTNRSKAAAAGLLWGAYHFGTGGNGAGQAQHFLDVVGTFDNTLLVLDFEQNPGGSSMSLDDARAFVTQVNQTTNRSPVSIPAVTSNNYWATTRIPCWLSVGSGFHNTGLHLSCLRTGPPGPCGSTPMACLAHNHTQSPALAIAIATSSTVRKINCERYG